MKRFSVISIVLVIAAVNIAWADAPIISASPSGDYRDQQGLASAGTLTKRVNRLEKALTRINQQGDDVAIKRLKQQVQHLNKGFADQQKQLKTLKQQNARLSKQLQAYQANAGQSVCSKTTIAASASGKQSYTATTKAESASLSHQSTTANKSVVKTDTTLPSAQATAKRQKSKQQSGQQTKQQTGQQVKKQLASPSTLSPNKANKADKTKKEVDTVKQSSPPLAKNAEQAYRSAFALIEKQQYKQAIPALKQFISDYPNASQVADGYYWLGQIYTINSQNAEAKQAFTKVINNYAKSNRAADAMLGLAFLATEDGQLSQAEKWLEKVKKDYPNSQAAKLADAKLEAIKSAS